MTRVAVTSSLDRSDEMASELVACGLQPVALPCTVAVAGPAEDLARMQGACDEVDLIVLDSFRPLQLLWPVGRLPRSPFAASSQAVATQISQRGGVISVVGDGRCLDFVGSLVADIDGKTVAFPHSANTDPRVVLALADAARQLVAASIYVNRSRAPGQDQVDAAVFLSALAVDGWAGSRSFTGIAVGVIGGQARAALRRYDRMPDVETESSVYGDLAAALARYLA